MKRLSLILILIILFNKFSFAQYSNLEANYVFAQRQYSLANYKISLVELLRVYYNDNNNQFPSICKDIANNFLLVNDYQNAIRYLDLHYFKTKDENEKNQIRYEKQKIFLSQANYNKALIEILQVNKKVEQDKDKYNFMLASNYLLSNQFSIAKNTMKKLSYYDKLDTNAINKHILKLEKNESRKSKTAKIASAIIPGLGQTLNGEIKDGINSFGLFVGFSILAVDLSSQIGYLDATTSVAPWMVRYYLGGILNAEKAFKKNKSNTKQKNILEIIDILQKGKI